MLNRSYQLFSKFHTTVSSKASRLGGRGVIGLTAIAVFAVVGSTLALTSSAATPDTFVFGAAGDHAAGPDSAKVMQRAGASNLDFFLTLGDLRYGDLTPSGWCQFVKTNINVGAGKPADDAYGQNFPFQLTMGNHDVAEFDQYISCLPDHMNSTAMPGRTYGRDYSFDYPSGSAPLARFIDVAPSLGYAMTKGSAQYEWLSSKIDEARANGIKWVIVASHYNYISGSSATNTARADFFNLLAEKKVDLVLEGHEHTYQRSHQLALGPSCPLISRNPADTDCVTGDGSGGTYTKGKGLVLVISGLGGRAEDSLPGSGDADTPYFAKQFGKTSAGNVPFGFTKFTVTPDSITSTFVRGDGGPSLDDFTITDSGSTPTPPPTPTPTPTPTPAPTTKSILPVADAVVRSGSPTSNFGTLARLQVDDSPKMSSLLKFTVSGTTGYTVTSAKLRLYTADGGPEGGLVYRTADTSWSETAVTWNTAPAIDASQFATFDAPAAGQWLETDVSALIAGDGTYSLRLNGEDDDQIAFHSKEGANKPQLVLELTPIDDTDANPPTAPGNLSASAVSSSQVKLEWTASTDDQAVKGYRIMRNGTDIGVLATGVTYTDSGLAASTSYNYAVAAVDVVGNTSEFSNAAVVTTPQPTAASTTTVFGATADASLKKASATQNYGSAKTLPIDSNAPQNALFRFAVSGLAGKPVQSAKLRLYVTNASPSGGDIYPVADTSWLENAVTWNTAPVSGTTKIASIGAVTASTWIEADVTGLIKAEGTYSLMIKGINTDTAAYNSRESAHKPQLLISY